MIDAVAARRIYEEATNDHIILRFERMISKEIIQASRQGQLHTIIDVTIYNEALITQAMDRLREKGFWVSLLSQNSLNKGDMVINAFEARQLMISKDSVSVLDKNLRQIESKIKEAALLGRSSISLVIKDYNRFIDKIINRLEKEEYTITHYKHSKSIKVSWL